MNHEEARKALFEGATVRARFANAKYVFDYKLVDGKIFWQCHNYWDGRLADSKYPWNAWTDSNGDFYSLSTRAATFTKLRPAWPKWYGAGNCGAVYRQDSASARGCTAFYEGQPPRERQFPATFFCSTRATRIKAAAWLRVNGHTAEADKIDPPKKVAPAPAKPAGLYSKFEVTKGGKPLDAGCFVLVPFKADSAINDEAAIKALQTYRAHCDPKLSEEIAAWLSNPTSRNGMNRPKGA